MNPDPEQPACPDSPVSPAGSTRADGADRLPLLPKRKKFLLPMILLLAAAIIGLPIGIFFGFTKIKSSEPYQITIEELESSEVIKRNVGLPIETSMIVRGSYDDQNGTYELEFLVSGPNGRAVVRSFCASQSEDEPWAIIHLAIGVGGREGQEFTIVGDPDNPPWGWE